jgi:heme-degrading monooxygenase HmoA
MILRVWRALATAENAPAYRRHLETSVVPELKKLAGFEGLKLCQRARQDGVEVLVMSQWRSMDAIKAFAGATPDQAVVEPAARAVLTQFDDFVSHYDVTLEVAGTA